MLMRCSFCRVTSRQLQSSSSKMDTICTSSLESVCIQTEVPRYQRVNLTSCTLKHQNCILKWIVTKQKIAKLSEWRRAAALSTHWSLGTWLQICDPASWSDSLHTSKIQDLHNMHQQSFGAEMTSWTTQVGWHLMSNNRWDFFVPCRSRSGFYCIHKGCQCWTKKKLFLCCMSVLSLSGLSFKALSNC